MRIAVLIISLFLTVIIGLQSCAVTVGGSLAKDQATSAGGAGGVVVAFLFVLGAAFSMGLPRVSQIVFLLASAVAFIAASGESKYQDMNVWGAVALILAVMSYLGVRELKNRKVPAQ